MTKEEEKELAFQLRKPHGEQGSLVAEFMNTGNATLYKNTIDALTIPDNSQILEVGMANGYFTKDIFKVNNQIGYVGLDYSPEMVRKATELNKDLITNHNIQFVQGDAHNLKFSDASFDIVFTINTIYFYNDAIETFKEFHRVLKDNGQLIVGLRPKHEMIQYPITQYGFKTFERSALSSIFEAANFNVDRIFEKKEPDQEINGKSIPVTSMIGIGIKQ